LKLCWHLCINITWKVFALIKKWWITFFIKLFLPSESNHPQCQSQIGDWLDGPPSTSQLRCKRSGAGCRWGDVFLHHSFTRLVLCKKRQQINSNNLKLYFLNRKKDYFYNWLITLAVSAHFFRRETEIFSALQHFTSPKRRGQFSLTISTRRISEGSLSVTSCHVCHLETTNALERAPANVIKQRKGRLNHQNK